MKTAWNFVPGALHTSALYPTWNCLWEQEKEYLENKTNRKRKPEKERQVWISHKQSQTKEVPFF